MESKKVRIDLRPLGNSRLKVSPVALGCWPIAGVTTLGANDADSIATIQKQRFSEDRRCIVRISIRSHRSWRAAEGAAPSARIPHDRRRRRPAFSLPLRELRFQVRSIVCFGFPTPARGFSLQPRAQSFVTGDASPAPPS